MRHLNDGNWDSPEDQGTRPINGETCRWYHLWDENDNAIRAIVRPQCLGNWAVNSIFGGLSVTDFAPDESPNDNALPKWKTITAPVNFYEAVMATVFVQSGTAFAGTGNSENEYFT